MEQTVSVKAVLEDQITKGIERLNKSFGGINKELENVKKRVQPVASGIARIAAAFAGVQAARRSIGLAREQVEAEQALGVALRGNVEQLEKIKKISSELQGRTIIGDESFIRSAATVRSLAGELERAEDTLLAIANFSAGNPALSFDSASTLVAKALAGQTSALTRYGITVGDVSEVVDELNRKFGGQAEALAQTDFGRVQQELNSAGDAAEVLGRQLVRVQVLVATGIKEITQAVTRFSELPVVRQVISVLEGAADKLGGIERTIGVIVASVGVIAIGNILAPVASVLLSVTKIGVAIAPIAAVVGGIVAGVVTWAKETGVVETAVDLVRDNVAEVGFLLGGIAIATIPLIVSSVKTLAVRLIPQLLAGVNALLVRAALFVAPFALAAVQVLAIGTAIAIAAREILRATGRLPAVEDFMRGVVSQVQQMLQTVRRVFQAVKDGKLSISEVAKLAREKLIEVGAILQAVVVSPVFSFFNDLETIVESSFQLVIKKIKAKMAELVASVNVQFIELARKLNKLPLINIELPEEKTEEALERGVEGVKQLGDAAVEAEAKKIRDALNFGDNIRASVEKGLEEAKDIAAEFAAKFESVMSEATRKGVEEGADAAAPDRAALAQTLRQAEGALQDRSLQQAFIEAIASGFDSPSLRRVLDSIPEAIRASVRDFPSAVAATIAALPTEAREQGGAAVLDALKREFEEQRLARIGLIEAQEAIEAVSLDEEIRARERAVAVAREQLRLAEERNGTEAERQEILTRISTAESTLFQADLARVRLTQEQLARRREEAEAVVDEAEAIESALQDATKVTFERLANGLIDVETAERQIRIEADRATNRISVLSGEIRQLGAGGKISAGDLAELLAAIDRVKQEAGQGSRLAIAEGITEASERAAAQVFQLANAVLAAKAAGTADDGTLAQLQAAEAAFANANAQALTSFEQLKASVSDPEILAQIEALKAAVVQYGVDVEKVGGTVEETPIAGSLEAGVDNWRAFAEGATSSGALAGNALNSLGDSMGSIFVDLMETGGKNVKKLALQFVASLAQMIAKAAALSLILQLLPGGSAIGGILGANQGGPVGRNRGGPVRLNKGGKAMLRWMGGLGESFTRYADVRRHVRTATVAAGVTAAAALPAMASDPVKLNAGGTPGSPLVSVGGGYVPGPKVDKDIIHALLTPEEWVIRRMATRYYGDRAMDAINRMLIPRSLIHDFLGNSGRKVLENATERFAGGGLVGAGSTGGGGGARERVARPQAPQPMSQRVVMVGGEQAYERMTAQGDRAYLDQAERVARPLALILREKGGLRG